MWQMGDVKMKNVCVCVYLRRFKRKNQQLIPNIKVIFLRGLRIGKFPSNPRISQKKHPSNNTAV